MIWLENATNILQSFIFTGAGSGTLTRMTLRPGDFKSPMYNYSITPALLQKINGTWNRNTIESSSSTNWANFPFKGNKGFEPSTKNLRE